MQDIIIETIDAEYTYQNHDYPVMAVDGVSMSVRQGEFIVVLGRNGSGKSTFARLLNALITPDSGKVIVLGMDSAKEENTWEIRKNVGMIFQNPDNQIVGTTVVEDVAFGPENLGVPPAEIKKRVVQALRDVGIYALMERAPHMLSGGQKQKVAIAGVLAMKPSCIILDESTSMLDPIGRKEVLDAIVQLNKKENLTVIHITHHMDEACLADRVIVVENGRIVSQGTPSEVFSDVEKIEGLGLDVPQVTRLMYNLRKAGLVNETGIITVDQAAERLGRLLG
ncbi:MAG: energy-coupling factor transporter ATPase [Clostridia bacterium]|nr:energy-coupling factor transporter ATPase [Clostridia bacterium]